MRIAYVLGGLAAAVLLLARVWWGELSRILPPLIPNRPRPRKQATTLRRWKPRFRKSSRTAVRSSAPRTPPKSGHPRRRSLCRERRRRHGRGRGQFEDVGLRVFPGGPKNPTRAVKYVALGIDEIGIAQQPQVLLATEEEGGAPLLAIGSVIKQNNSAMIWLPGSGIGDIADLKGKTIGIPGVPFQEAFLEEVLARAGLTLEDVEVKRTNYRSMAALLEGRVDAIFGVTWNVEGAALEARGAEPVIKRAQSLGTPRLRRTGGDRPRQMRGEAPSRVPRLHGGSCEGAGGGSETITERPSA